MRNRTAMLIVDVQTALMRDGIYQGQETVQRIGALADRCRAKNEEVIFVRHDDGPGSTVERGTAGWEIVAELTPRAGERIFDKRENSAFRDTGLKEYLQEKGIGRLILTGMQTEYCIDTTCKVAFEYGYQVIIPAGTVTTFDNQGIPAPVLNAFYSSIWDGRFARCILYEEMERYL